MCLWTARTPQCLGGEMLAQRWEADGQGALGVYSVSPPAARLVGLRQEKGTTEDEVVG